MASIEDIAVNVLVEAPECPSAVAEHIVLRAARDLCKRARCWRLTVPTAWDSDGIIDLAADLALVPDNNTDYSPELVDVISITSVEDGWTKPLKAKTQTQMDKINPEWRSDTGTPLYYVPYTGETGNEEDLSDGMGKFKLSPAPTSASSTTDISGISKADPAVITATSHGFTVGDRIRIMGASDLLNEWAYLNGLNITCVATTSGSTITTEYNTSGFTGSYAEQTLNNYVQQIDADARVAVCPTSTATNLSEVLLRHYEETIISGALSYVLRMPNTPWFSPEMSAFHKAEYEKGVETSKTKADDENMTRGKRWR